MGLLLFWVSFFLFVEAYGGNVKLLKTPLTVSPLDSATFGFEVSDPSGGLCTDCTLTCKLDNYNSSHCKSKEVSFKGLHDGDHTFEVCANGSLGYDCVRHNWTVDTVPPTANVSASASFTSMSNVSVHIKFNKPCTGEGGFRCSSNYCSLLVYGTGYVIPSTLKVLQPDLEFSLLVAISTDKLYGRLVLVMDKEFCTDTAGNRFTRTQNSSFLLHFDRRNVSIQLRSRIPKRSLQIEGETRTVEATNKGKTLRVYLYFSEPVCNSSAQILDTLRTSSGSLSPLGGDSLGSRRFGYSVSSLSSMAIVTVTCESSAIISRSGTPCSPSDPVTFLYDAQRPSVSLTTTSNKRTREHHIPVLIKFVKPVFGFNSSAISISGCHLLSFQEISWSVYRLEVHADDSIVSIEVPENTAKDVAGNNNLASNRLQVRHYSVPMVSSLVSTITTVVFASTSMVAGLLTVSTASLLSSGVFSKPATYLISEPSRNLLRIACHIQVFALTKWLAVSLPIEYYEFARGIEWSIPYLTLPWETEGLDSFTKDSTPPTITYSRWERSKFATFEPSPPRNGRLSNSSLYGTPLSPMEYRLFLEGQNMKPEAQLVMGSQNSYEWKYFGRNMFWLAVICGGLMLLHAILLFTLKLRRKKSEEQKEFGALVFPRFELFLLFLALPCICQASAAITRGRSTAGIAVGIVLFGIASFLILSLLLFLSIGITLGKLLQYKEVHQEGQEPHWYQELVRISLGPGKRGQWTWKDKPNSTNLTRFGPLFEDLRGPPKYMLSQFSAGPAPAPGDRIIASDDENEDAEAPCIQKLFGILRIYYTILESIKRASLGILAGIYSDHAPSKLPIVILLSICAFQLFFLMLKKPFIKKRVQLVEIISVATELFIFASSLVLVENDFSESSEKKLGFVMLAVFVIGFVAQLINEWYSLYWQIRRLNPKDTKFVMGLKIAAIGVLRFVFPSGISADLGQELDGKSPGTGEKPWMRQLRELAKESFNKEDEWTMGPKDPSTSKSGFCSGKDPSSSKSGFWGGKRSSSSSTDFKAKDPSSSKSGFWGGKRSGSSSVTSSTDFKAKGDLKAKSKGLYKDLEAIFSSKQ